MATASGAPNIPLPAPLRTSSNLAGDWKRFKGQWTNYKKAAKLNHEEKDCQAAIFLACIGADAYEIYTTLEFANDADRDDPDKLVEAFERHCIGELNEVYERYLFNRRQQEAGETFDVFIGDLRRLVRTCQYGTAEESVIRDRIVLGIHDDATRKKLLQTRKLDLPRAIDICRSAEATTRQLKTITTPDEVHAMDKQPDLRHRSIAYRPRGQSRGPRDKSYGYRTTGVDRSSPSPDRRCRYCDRFHDASKQACPAYNAVCNRCHKRNHFQVCCRSQPRSENKVCELQYDESLLSLDNADNRRVYSNVFVNGHKVRFMLDCGSTVCLLPASELVSIGRYELRPPRSTLRMFDHTILQTVGMLTARVRHPRTQAEFDVDFYVTERDGPVLGIDVCRRLDMLRIVEENICELREHPSRETALPPLMTSSVRLTEAAIFHRYADLFDGSLGLLEGEIHLEVDRDVPPVQMPLRRIPIAMRDREETELMRLQADGVIEPVSDRHRGYLLC